MSVDTVDVWLISLDLPAGALAECEAVLDEAERRRAGAIRDPRSRARFVAAHGAVRRILAGRLAVPPQRLWWRHGEHGKPALAEPAGGPECNLSHSGELAMLAVSERRPVGVDIQRPVDPAAAARLAWRYFPEPEARLVSRADHPAVVFGRLWARKEACAKAAGGRLLPHLAWPVAGPRGWALVSAPAVPGQRHDTGPAGERSAGPGGRRTGARGDPPAYRVCDLPAPAGWHAAVALRGAAPYRLVGQVWPPGTGARDPADGCTAWWSEEPGQGPAHASLSDRPVLARKTSSRLGR